MNAFRLLVLTFLLLGPAYAAEKATPFEQALEAAQKALEANKRDEAWSHIERALERDAQSLRAWQLRARWAEASKDKDEQVYCLHKILRLSIAQGEPKTRIDERRARLRKIDPVANSFLNLKTRFRDRLLPLAKQYEKKKWRHSAIRVHREILAIDPEHAPSRAAIERISAAPDPSLAETAKAEDPLADVSEAWIQKHDAQHDTWKTRSKLKSEHYTVQTDTGYEVMVRTAEVMDQMNAFYRTFFQHGTPEKPKAVPRIFVSVFKDKDEYLKLGSSPEEWSRGQFTGGAVETYIAESGFDRTTRTLFHEAAHQFVALTTNATGWLNEGLACFFEGCRIQANGTVLMNLPADHRLFPLARRMSKGWMADHNDGIDPDNPSSSNPQRAPTFRIIIEDRYEWGPSWYAPTWGVVYFLYNYQDPVDGRFIYRSAFETFIDKSGGRVGKGAVENFEKVVLAAPRAPTPGVDFSKKKKVVLPRTATELDEVWKQWILQLADVQSGKVERTAPYLDWARHAATRKEFGDATKHFEKGLIATPTDVELRIAFADHLVAVEKNKDRASKLVLKAMRILEAEDVPDKTRIEALEQRLLKWDKTYRRVKAIRKQLAAAAHTIVKEYADAKQDMMVMEVSRRFVSELRIPGMEAHFAAAARRSKKTLALWRLVYNESDLSGWASGGRDAFIPAGPILRAQFGTYMRGRFDYKVLTLDQVTSGDFSMEAEVQAFRYQNTFCGLVFGRKGTSAFHTLVFFPGAGMTAGKDEGSTKGFVDLVSFFAPGVYKIWRHNPVQTAKRDWHKLRLDITGKMVDIWFDGELVVTQEFSNLDVLRGSFGLITGRGDARFRNVRYLARALNDPTALVERELRMEPFKVAGKAVAGSWLNQVPPWLEPAEWLQNERTSWDEKGPVPTLFVIWSVRQNRIVSIHEWLHYLQRRYADTGLEIVSIAGADKPRKVKMYLRVKRFPGAVAVDSISARKGGYGTTLDMFEVGKRFNLPRLLLLGIDQKVAWEGEPGFEQGRGWRPGVESYMDAPLEDLVKKQKLRELFKWRKAWASKGDFETKILPLLAQSRQLSAKSVPAVAEARLQLQAVRSALTSVEATAKTLSKDGREPALRTLVAWADRIHEPVSAGAKKAIKRYLKSKRTKDWDRALALARKAQGKKVDPKLIGQIERLQGPFPRSLAKDLKAAVDAGDSDKAKKLLEEAPKAPGRWLAKDYLKLTR